ncbi:unnamed protein product [Discosporangium mesarthrocarpum]
MTVVLLCDVSKVQQVVSQEMRHASRGTKDGIKSLPAYATSPAVLWFVVRGVEECRHSHARKLHLGYSHVNSSVRTGSLSWINIGKEITRWFQTKPASFFLFFKVCEVHRFRPLRSLLHSNDSVQCLVRANTVLYLKLGGLVFPG